MRGPIGEQPVIAGERYEYERVPLPTSSGFVTGRYQMVSEAASSSRSTCRPSRWTVEREAGVELTRWMRDRADEQNDPFHNERSSRCVPPLR